MPQERSNPPPLGATAKTVAKSNLGVGLRQLGLGAGFSVNDIQQQPFMIEPKKTAHHINDEQDYRRAKSLRQTSSLAERLLWNDLRQLSKTFNLKFRRQHPIHPYIVDFTCIACKLVIEIDGESHDARQEQDATRTRHLNNLGYTVMRFTNEDVYRNREGVIRNIIQKAETLVKAQPATPPLTPPQGEGN